MSDTEKAIEYFEELLKKLGNGDSDNKICAVALEALQEKRERERGCEYCDDPDCPPLDWRCGLDHILPDYKLCPMCGRKLEG